jgi:Flp pilus assembly protein TadG
MELAFVVPILLVLALGCVDFGRFAYHHIAVTNAARAGAEHAIMHPYTSATQNAWAAQVQNLARAELTGQTGCNPNYLTTTTTPTLESNGLRRVWVQATYTPFQTLVPWPGVPSTVTLRSTVVMRLIR